MKRTKFGVLAVLAATAALLTISCELDEGAWSDDTVDRRELLALLHAADSHENAESDLQEEVLSLLQADSVSRSASGQSATSVISGVKKFTTTIEDGFSSYPANARSASAEEEASEIPFYLFSLENEEAQTEGFALACGDNRIGSLIALVENGEYDDTENPFSAVFNDGLEDYILRTIEEYNSITEAEIEEAVKKHSAEYNEAESRAVSNRVLYDTPVQPLTASTKWGQKEPYWDVINSIAGITVYDNKYLTGCVATAMAQIMAYHNWPQKPASSLRRPNLATSTTSFRDPYSNTTKYFSNITYEWAKMKAQSNASLLSNNAAKTEIGVLMLEIGGKVGMTYRHEGSSASNANVPAAFQSMGYKQSAIQGYSIDAIKTSIDLEKPVYICAYSIQETAPGSVTYSEGHTWIIDAYRTRTLSTQVFLPSTGRTIVLTGAEYQVHCNLGWADYQSGWYISGIFDTRDEAGPVASYRAIEGQDRNYQFYKLIIPNITPNR